MGTFLFYCYTKDKYFAVIAKDSWAAKRWAFENITDLHYYTKDITGVDHNYTTYKA